MVIEYAAGIAYWTGSKPGCRPPSRFRPPSFVSMLVMADTDGAPVKSRRCRPEKAAGEAAREVKREERG
jgi:hypothetical protein